MSIIFTQLVTQNYIEICIKLNMQLFYFNYIVQALAFHKVIFKPIIPFSLRLKKMPKHTWSPSQDNID